jgi:hypothetical protein
MEDSIGGIRAVLGGSVIRRRRSCAGLRFSDTGWFKDLSLKFLSVKAGRLLILAGTDRLDKTLTIGQMQGTNEASPKLY